MGARNSRKFEFKLGKTGMIVFVLGLSFLVFFSFLFGVKVGKNIEVYPEKLARGVPVMIKDVLGLSSVMQEEHPVSLPAEGDILGDGVKNDFDLTFYDTLGGKRGITGPAVSGNDKLNKSMTDEIKQPAAADVKKTEITPAVPVEKKVEMPVAALPTVKENKKPASADARKTEITPAASTQKKVDSSIAAAPSTTSANKKLASLPPKGDLTKPGIHRENGKCLVQVVSFPEKSKAEGVSKRLTGMGYKPRIVAADIPGKGKWFRVVVTGFNNRQDAQKASDRIAKSVSGVNCVVLAE